MIGLLSCHRFSLTPSVANVVYFLSDLNTASMFNILQALSGLVPPVYLDWICRLLSNSEA